MTGDEVFAIRKKLGLSQTALAERLGVVFATVNRWENGHYPVKRRFELALLALEGIDAASRTDIVATLRRTIGELSGLLHKLEQEAGGNPCPTEAVASKEALENQGESEYTNGL
jgi:transcriptional regulator with XRE-family HTH domain